MIAGREVISAIALPVFLERGEVAEGRTLAELIVASEDNPDVQLRVMAQYVAIMLARRRPAGGSGDPDRGDRGAFA